MKGGYLRSPLLEWAGRGRGRQEAPCLPVTSYLTLLRVSVPSPIDGTEVKGREVRPSSLVVSREGAGKERRIAG